MKLLALVHLTIQLVHQPLPIIAFPEKMGTAIIFAHGHIHSHWPVLRMKLSAQKGLFLMDAHILNFATKEVINSKTLKIMYEF